MGQINEYEWYIIYSDSMYFKPNKATVQLCNPENMLRFKQDETTINKGGRQPASPSSFEMGTESSYEANCLSHQLKGIKTVLS